MMAVGTLLAAPTLSAQQPVGEVFATDASVRGSMVMTSNGTQVMSGSQVTAGLHPAVLRLTRGGAVRICPGTSLAVSESSTGSPLLFGISAGAVEAHYTVGAMADSLVTPDFRIQFAGPGTFHVAVGADPKGNTCVRSLEGNTASVIVAEMMGSGAYQVAPGHEVMFKEGKLEDAAASDEACGCPEVKLPAVEITKDVPSVAVPPEPAPAKVAEPEPAVVEMDAPLTFHGDKTQQADDSRVIATLRRRPLKITSVLMPSKRVTEKKVFFGAIGAFFARLFK